jgi:hypothetical protein
MATSAIGGNAASASRDDCHRRDIFQSSTRRIQKPNATT